MKTVKKVKKIIVDGQVKKTEDVKEKATRLDEAKEVVRRVMDSTAQHYKLQAQRDLNSAKQDKKNIDLIVWEEVEEKKKEDKKPSKTKS